MRLSTDIFGGFAVSLIAFFLISCNGSGKVEGARSSGQEVFKPESDLLHIELPLNVLPGLIYPSLLSNVVQSELLVAYSPFDHALVFFDLTQRKFLQKIRLDEHGPNKVAPVGSVSYVKENVIWLSSDYELTKVNSEGKVMKRIKLIDGESSFDDFDFSRLELLHNSQAGLQISSTANSALINVNSLDRQFPQRYAGERLTEVDLTDGRLKLLNVTIPEEYTTLNGNYGELTRVGFSRNGEMIVYNFPMSSDVFLLDGNESVRYKVNSLHGDDIAKPIEVIDGNIDLARAKHLYEALTYYPPFFDHYQNRYYRSYKTAVENDLEESEYYCVVFDETLQKLGEFKFPKNYYVYPIISREGLMFMAFNKHDDKLELIRYRFNEELE